MLLQGLPLDGRVIKRVKLGGWIRTDNVRLAGLDRTKSPSVAIQYFDEKRNRIGINYVGMLQGTNAWKLHVDEFRVPPLTREAIISVGLLGAVGTAQFDGLVFEPIKK
jgi:protein-L-isoaspartate(D-aspartate) O-methyltransferase